MKKIINFLEIVFIALIIIIAFMLSLKFIYNIKNETINNNYYLDIKINELIIEEGSKLDDISYDDESLNLSLTFNEENEFCLLKIKLINEGSMPAKLTEISKNIKSNNEILKYTITYEDQTDIKKGDIILPKEEKIIKIYVHYPPQAKKIYDELNIELNINLNYNVVQ